MRDHTASWSHPEGLLRAVGNGFIALTILAVVAVTWMSYDHHLRYYCGYLRILSQMRAQHISERIISRHPESWKHEAARIEALLGRQRPEAHLSLEECVYDSDGRLIAAVGACRGAPCLREHAELRDAGVSVGMLEIRMELNPLVRRTAMIGTVATLMGLVAIGLFGWFPMRGWRESQQRVCFLAEHDPLTELLNRQAAERVYAHERARASRHELALSVLIFDIDHFKRINDSYGHERGDQVLRALTALVSEQLRASDTLVRWGGEEFVIIAPHTTVDLAVQFGEKLRAAVEAAHVGIPEAVTISIGISPCERTDSLPAAVDRADEALYRAKRAGRNRVERAESG
ncbi:diguanylate cyclase [Halochromatium salexigens]|uniref:diguanylate cyclase n=1 Tax=Halochromatium salexigens TaxID=49447 RepID=UPI001911B3B0